MAATIATGIAGKEVTGIVSASLSLSGETINVSATNLTAGYSSLLGVEPTFVSPAAKFVMQGPSERSCRGQNGRRGSRGSSVVAWHHGLLPARARQDLLDHEGVDVDPAVLNQVQREHADLVVLAAIAGHLTAPGEEHEVCGAVPLLDDVQPLVDLVAQRFRTQVSAQKIWF